MNKTVLTAMLLGTSCLAQTPFAAEAGPGRQCNLQGREIALRISEEVSGRISADDRQQIARIAEEVCMDYAGNRGMGRRAENAMVEESVVGREAPAEAEEIEDEEEERGFFNLKFIDPEDKVRRTPQKGK